MVFLLPGGLVRGLRGELCDWTEAERVANTFDMLFCRRRGVFGGELSYVVDLCGKRSVAGLCESREPRKGGTHSQSAVEKDDVLLTDQCLMPSRAQVKSYSHFSLDASKGARVAALSLRPCRSAPHHRPPTPKNLSLRSLPCLPLLPRTLPPLSSFRSSRTRRRRPRVVQLWPLATTFTRES